MIDSSNLANVSTLRNAIFGNGDALLIDSLTSPSHAADLPLIGAEPVPSGTLDDALSTALPAAAPLTGVLSQAGALGSALGTGTSPLEGVLNETILDFHTSIEEASHEIGIPYTVHGVTNLGETVGLGRIGDPNLVTDVLGTPSDVLTGSSTHIAHIPADIGAVAGAAETLVQGVATDVANGGIVQDTLANPLAPVEALASFPSTVVANEAVGALHATLEGTLDPVLPYTIHGVTGLGNTVGLGEIGGSNLLTDALQTPGALLGGDTTPLSHVPVDAAHIVQSVGNAVAGVGIDLGQSPITSTVGDAIGHAPGVLPGLALPGTGLPGLGALSGDSGTHDLVTAAIGPQAPTSGLNIDVLSATSNSPGHTVDLHAITAPATVPTLANVALAPDSLHLPLAGGGGDALAGALNTGGASAAPQAAAPAVAAAPIAHLDVVDLHINPLETLAHAAHHA